MTDTLEPGHWNEGKFGNDSSVEAVMEMNMISVICRSLLNEQLARRGYDRSERRAMIMTAVLMNSHVIEARK